MTVEAERLGRQASQFVDSEPGRRGHAVRHRPQRARHRRSDRAGFGGSDKPLKFVVGQRSTRVPDVFLDIERADATHRVFAHPPSSHAQRRNARIGRAVVVRGLD